MTHDSQRRLGQGLRHCQAKFFAVRTLLPQGEKPLCLSHGTARAASVLLKVVAALFDNLKFVLSPSYAPSRKFKEAAQIAAHAPPTPALRGSELPRIGKKHVRMCRHEDVSRHHLRNEHQAHGAHGQERGAKEAAQDARRHLFSL